MCYEALLAVTTPFSSWSCLLKRCTTSVGNTSLRQLIKTQHQKVRGERSKRIGTCAVAIVFEMNMWKQSVSILARIIKRCNKKVHDAENLPLVLSKNKAKLFLHLLDKLSIIHTDRKTTSTKLLIHKRFLFRYG